MIQKSYKLCCNLKVMRFTACNGEAERRIERLNETVYLPSF